MEQKKDLTVPEAAPAEPKESTPAQPPKTPLEGLYDRFEGLSLKKLDIFIGICTALLVAVLVVGFIQARM